MAFLRCSKDEEKDKGENKKAVEQTVQLLLIAIEDTA